MGISAKLCGLVLFIATVMMVKYITAQDIEIDEGPGNATVVLGGSTVLRCSWKVGSLYLFFLRRAVLFTHHDASFMCRGRFSDPTPRHTCEELDRERDYISYELSIRDITLEDAGSYSCSVGNEPRSMPAPGYLTVITPPHEDSPQCQMNDPVSDLKVGADIQITCNSSGGLPPAQLSWYQGPNLVAGPSHGVVTYTHRITGADDGLELTCLLNSSALSNTRTCSAIVDIPPEAEMQPGFMSIQSGGNATFRCTGRYFQEDNLEYSWYFQTSVSDSLKFDKEIQDDVLYLSNVRTDRDAEEFDIVCLVVSVSNGSSTGELTYSTAATIQIVSVQTTLVAASNGSSVQTTPVAISGSPGRFNPGPSSGVSTPVIVICSVVPVVVVVIITCLILLLRVRMKRRREVTCPVSPQAGDDVQCTSGQDYMDLRHMKDPKNDSEKSVYQDLVPEYQDLTCTPDPDGDGTRPVSEAVYENTGCPDEVSAISNEYARTPIAVGVPREKADELYVNHAVVKGKRQTGPRK